MALQESSLFSLQRVYLLLVVPLLQDPVQLWQGGSKLVTAARYTPASTRQSGSIKGRILKPQARIRRKRLAFFLALSLAVCSSLVAFSGFRAKQTDAARRRKRTT
ncbi:hypothetical protein H112_04154 [Trichophyton rubrum D6]|uniref:Uncharacterized protein n=3 Tax=Trichophyton TaxID=5550 RepID=A0A080WKS0_TRIRC|nr:uncharacterized protein TERG_12082 [Trichophyton rubrum CBS 118892]EZF23115.1 hypothetical protein H100_04159 [Trichophyton rubrum MR850]EZF42157.1 hypothetical protein H102_04147 [Trichophyton rubrum CBS 100081]EZF52769.1 hypothetical protein H103_04158 [Trichophyton rubrum CBS 288.86]EZF63466.1 hypothetical protein H104_04144 [Trichophyton rubrum CBS 289.86]EZF74054.1 hypothetical protein H105_04176 [Trichophyton soudanense CBS 452.61]EZF84721.1 hypothetical protein H110_04151 [Trichophy